MRSRARQSTPMKNITVSVDEETHRLVRARAAELDTSVSALVRDYLRSLARDRDDEAASKSTPAATNGECRRGVLKKAFEEIRAPGSGFKVTENLSREQVHDRNAIC